MGNRFAIVPVKVDEATGDIMVSLQTTKPAAEEATAQRESRHDSESSQQKYYEEEERKADNKLFLEFLSKESQPGTDITTFKLTRSKIHYTAGQ